MKSTLNTTEAGAPPLAGANAGIPEKDIATIELLRRWREEDATDDPELIRRAEIELEEFKRNMNENRRRVGAPPIYP